MTNAFMYGLFAAALGFAACGDDGDDKTDTTPDAETQQETQQETVQETQQETAQETQQETVEETQQETVQETVQETTEETTPGGSCTNASDLAVIGNPDTDPSEKAGACGINSCIADALGGNFDAFETCVQTCMLNASLPNYMFVVSADCSLCFTKSVRCAAENCLGVCAGGADAPACVQCREDNNCTADFYTCSGLEP